MSRKILAFLCVLTLTLAIVPAAFAANTIGFRVEPSADFNGIDIKLDALVKAAGPGVGEGVFEFQYEIEALEEGGAFKVLTQNPDGQENGVPFERFTNRDPLPKGAHTITTGTRTDDGDNAHPVTGAVLVAAAGAGHVMRFNQQSTTVPYILKEITITHIFNGQRAVVYKMSMDGGVSGLVDGADFVETDMLMLAGDPTVKAVVISGAPAQQTEAPKETKAPAAAHNSRTGVDSSSVVVALALLLLSSVAAVVLFRKRRGIQE